MNRGQVLVTGAAGWVGDALVRRLAADGWRVRAASRSALRPPPAAPAGAVAHLPGLELSADTDWRAALDGVQAVVHCAARVHVTHDRSADPLQAFRRVNTEGTLALARQAAGAGVHRFVFLSSAHVNGTQGSCTQPYTADEPPRPDTPYGLSKWEAEQGLQALAGEHGMALVVLRPPLVAGAGVGGNLRSLVRAVARGVPLPLASIDNRRSMVGLPDLVDVIQLGLTHPQAAGHTWMVADPLELSTPDLVRLLARHLGRPARLLPFPVAALRAIGRLSGRSGTVRSLCGCLRLDAGPLATMLGWRPRTGIEASLGQAVAHLRARGAW